MTTAKKPPTLAEQLADAKRALKRTGRGKFYTQVRKQRQQRKKTTP